MTGEGSAGVRPPVASVDRVMELLDELVAMPTVTGTPNLALIAWCRDLLEGLGARCTTTTSADGERANLLATIGPDVDGGVVLSGHTDVVPAGEVGDWASPPFALDVRDGRVHGRGTVDMKGFIACALAVAPTAAHSALRRPLHLALTFDEEVGCRGAPLLLEQLLQDGPRPAVAIVGEPTSMGVITAHKGCFEYTVDFTGREGHGSAPAAGVNAVEFAARYVAGLVGLREELAARTPERPDFDPPETTLNVGMVTGGSARNVIAGSCAVEWEFRPVQEGDARYVHEEVGAMEAALREQMQASDPGASLTRTIEGAVDGLAHDPDSPALALCRRLLDDPKVDVAAFSTEAGLYQRAGIPAVICGPGSIEVAHQPDEYVELDQLEASLGMLRRLVAELTEPDPQT